MPLIYRCNFSHHQMCTSQSALVDFPIRRPSLCSGAGDMSHRAFAKHVACEVSQGH